MTMTMTERTPESSDERTQRLERLRLSLVRDDLPFRLQRAIGLIPAEGLGVARRALFYAAVTWLPIAVWAAVAGRALPGAPGEPLLQHFGIHVRFLVTLPLFILGEAVAHGLTMRLVPQFFASGIVPEREAGRLEAVVRGVAWLRSRTLPWIAIAGAIAAWTAVGTAHRPHELAFASPDPSSGPAPALSFGAIWFLYVGRPIFLALLCGWLWRLVIAFVLMARVARLDLAIVPTHPDRAGGLGFVEWFPRAFAPFAFALSALLAASWAHDVLYHGVDVLSLKHLVAAFLVAIVILCLAPLVPFVRVLGAAKRRALLDYGALVGEHGRLVRRRWVLRETVAEGGEVLDAPEIGPVVDANAMYEAVKAMRTIPIGRSALLSIAIPAVLPMLALAAVEIPLKEIFLRIVGTLT